MPISFVVTFDNMYKFKRKIGSWQYDAIPMKNLKNAFLIELACWAFAFRWHLIVEKFRQMYITESPMLESRWLINGLYFLNMDDC